MAVRAIQDSYTNIKLLPDSDIVEVQMNVHYLDSTAHTEFGETVFFQFNFTDLGVTIRQKLQDAIIAHGAAIGFTIGATDIYYIAMSRGV